MATDELRPPDEPGEASEATSASRPRPQRFSMLREYTLADLFTIGNAACGTVSIFLCMQYLSEDSKRFLWISFVLIPAAFILDGFDGWVARRQRRWSRIGADMDSLADIVSFGVAPAALGYTLGMRGGWDTVFLVYFVVCGISRLARYNVTAADLADASTGKVKYFEGTPIPTSLAIVAMLGVAFGVDAVGLNQMWGGDYRILGWLVHPLVLVYALSGSLMISTFRIPKP